MKRLQYLLVAACALGSLTCGGCATILSGDSQSVTIKSTPSGAAFTVVTPAGEEIDHGVTPQTLRLKRGGGYFQAANLRVLMQKEGYAACEKKIDQSLNPMYVGNIIFGGLIGLVIVDPISGAMFSYPNEVNVTLPPKMTAQTPAERGRVPLMSAAR
jgi:hypothetical protein